MSLHAKVVELSIPFEPNKFVASSLECDRGTHMSKIASQRFSDQNVGFLSVFFVFCMVLLSISMPTFLFFQAMEGWYL